MKTPGSADEGREIARVVYGAVGPAIAPGATRGVLTVAREVAQLLSLEGLDHVLRALEPHAGAPWPPALVPAVDRLARLCAAAEAAGSVMPFERADLELMGLAMEIEALEWSPPAGPAGAAAPAVPTLGVGDVIESLPGGEEAETPSLRRVRLRPPVAAALRAALDWLAGEHGPRPPLRVATEDSMLEVWAANVDPQGLRPASDVLASVDGNLGPVTAGAPSGTWRVRVPAHAARESFLMVIQGGVPLALPWHSVIHVHLLPAEEAAEVTPAAPVLPPLVPLGDLAGERPFVMVAHGLRHAWMLADQLVWRFPAEACEPAGPPPSELLAGMVRTEEGETWWRVDVARLLAGVEPLAVPEPAPRAAAPAPAAPSPPPTAAPAPLPPPRLEVITSETVPPPPAPRPRAPRPRLLLAQDVEPLPAPVVELGRAAVEPIEVAPPPPPAPPVAPEAPAEPRASEAPGREPEPVEPTSASAPAEPPAPTLRPRRALIVEDSLMAAVFLTRMLERHGFEVETVTSAQHLEAALARGPWGLVGLDLELPDARGTELALRVRRSLARHGSSAFLVALVRDADDARAARAASIDLQLRKPFDREELVALIARLGFAGAA